MCKFYTLYTAGLGIFETMSRKLRSPKSLSEQAKRITIAKERDTATHRRKVMSQIASLYWGEEGL